MCVLWPEAQLEVFCESNMEQGLGGEGQGDRMSGQRQLSRWRRGLRPRGVGPDPLSRWVGGTDRGDSGYGTSALS